MYWEIIIDFFHPADSLLGLHVYTAYEKEIETNVTTIQIGLLLINIRIRLGKKGE